MVAEQFFVPTEGARKTVLEPKKQKKNVQW